MTGDDPLIETMQFAVLGFFLCRFVHVAWKISHMDDKEIAEFDDAEREAERVQTEREHQQWYHWSRG